MAHAIQLTFDSSSTADVRDRLDIDTNKKFNSIVREEEQQPTVVEDIDGTEYGRALYRFSDSEDLPALLLLLTDGTFRDVDWYQIQSHICDHDQSTQTGCTGWELEAIDGDVPDAIKRE